MAMFRGGAHLFLAACLLLCLSSVSAIERCVGRLPNFQHDIAGELCIIDQDTMIIRGFGYDGGGPQAYLYYYTHEDGYTASNVPRDGGGAVIPHPETGGRLPTRRVSGIDLQFTLPEGVGACDIAVFTIWCDLANTHFTAKDIPEDIFTTDMADDSRVFCTSGGGGGGGAGFDNCKQLDDSVTLSWTVDKDSESVEFMLCGCRSTDTEQANTWLGFGLSANPTQTLMFGADATIVWVDDEEGPQAVDYHLSDYAQCRAGVGACPDTLDSSGTCTNDVTLVRGFSEDGQQCVVFSRNFAAGDDECDLPLDPDNEDQYIVWGVGGLGETAFQHFINAQQGDPPLHLGRAPFSDCQPLVCSTCDPYQNRRLAAPSDTTFVAEIGPSASQRGYMGITGRAGWGIAWYINGTLIPELVVQRGQTYTFIVYGGDNDQNPARYHPFYITDSINGGRLLNTVEERVDEEVFAGFEAETPIGVGPLCEYGSNVNAEEIADICTSLLCHYENALTPPDCGVTISSSGTNIFTWTPDESTPEVVYYQCATHQNLGWKITVTDSVIQYLETNGGSDTTTTTVIGEDSPPVCPTLVTGGTSNTFHTSLPLFISLILVNTLALLFI